VYAKSLPFVLGKKVGAPAGTTVVLEVTGAPGGAQAGAQPQVLAAGVGADGRGAAIDQLSTEPTSRLVLDFETWMLLAGGRRAQEELEVELHGDTDLARKVLDNLGVTL
jgi:hypothetical protein